MAVLSISIPTYNRVSLLEDLVRSILSIQSDDVEVVVTNNCSTDNTLEMLDGIKDERLKIFNNKEPLPACYNMIVSLFHAEGRYVMHCNDRDVIDIDKLINFIYFLRDKEYSFVCCKTYRKYPTYKLTEYEKGYESLMSQPYARHPTGMVYNTSLTKKYLRKEDYLQYMDAVYPWNFLLRDIVVYEKSAEYDTGLWNERPSNLSKRQLKSGAVYKGRLFFELDTTISLMNSVIDHVIGNSHFSLNREQEKALILNIIKFFKDRLIWHKHYFADVRECAHYGIKPHYFGYYSVYKMYQTYVDSCTKMIERIGYTQDLSSEWQDLSSTISHSSVSDCYHTDIRLLRMYIGRLLKERSL